MRKVRLWVIALFWVVTIPCSVFGQVPPVWSDAISEGDPVRALSLLQDAYAAEKNISPEIESGYLLAIAECKFLTGESAHAVTALQRVCSNPHTLHDLQEAALILLQISISEKRWDSVENILGLLAHSPLDATQQSRLSALKAHYLCRSKQYQTLFDDYYSGKLQAENGSGNQKIIQTEVAIAHYSAKIYPAWQDSADHYFHHNFSSYPNLPPWFQIYRQYYRARFFKKTGQDSLNLEALTVGAETFENSTIYSDFGVFLLRSLGSYYYSSLTPARALPPYRKALEIHESRKDSLYMMDVCDNLGNVFYSLNDFGEAEIYYRKEIDILLNLPNIPQEKLGKAYNNLANNLSQSQKDQQALSYYQEAIPLLTASNFPDFEKIATTCRNVGFLYLSKKEWTKAEEYLSRSAHYLEATGAEMVQQRAITLNSIAFTQLQKGNPELANATLKEVGRLLAQAPGTPLQDELECHYVRALALRQSEGPLAALPEIQRALRRLTYRTYPTDWRGNPHPDSVFTAPAIVEMLLTKASLLEEAAYFRGDTVYLGYLQNALATYEDALRHSQKFRGKHRSETSKILSSQSLSPLYEGGVTTAFALHQLTGEPAYFTRAFHFSEAGKASLLHESLTEEEALRLANIPDSLVNRKQRIDADVSELEWEVSRPNGSGFLTDLLTARSEQLLLDARLKLEFPKYAQLTLAPGSPQIEAVKAHVQAHQATLIEYFPTSEDLFLFGFTSDSTLFLKVPLSPQFNASVDTFLQELSTEPTHSLLSSRLLRHEKHLYDRLIKPVAPQLGEHVWIIPHGVLNYIPFETLIIPDGNPQKIHQAHFLVEDHAISYHYSAGLMLESARAKPVEYTWDVLGFAPDFREDLPPLKASLANMRQFGKQYLRTRVLAGKEGRKSIFLADGPQARILDLATHTRVDSLQPLNSRLFFSPSDSSDELFLHELYNLHLPAELAVLEACESGKGRLAAGEGVMSLARGFTAAGCRSILMTLWEVPDGVGTGEITGGFFAGLADSLPRDIALARAKRTFLADIREARGLRSIQAHPYFWGEFVLIGNDEPLILERKAPAGRLVILLIGILSVLLIAMLWWQGKKNPRPRPRS